MALVIKADDIDDYFTCINYNPSYRLAAIIISNTNFTVRIKWYHLKIFKECLFLCSCRYTVDCLAASTAMKQTPMFSLLSVAFSYNKSHLCSWHILNTEMSVTMVSVEILRPLEKKNQKNIEPPTKQVILCHGVEDAWGPDEVAHGSRQRGGINSDEDEGVPNIDVSQETVIPLKEKAATVWRIKLTDRRNQSEY